MGMSDWREVVSWDSELGGDVVDGKVCFARLRFRVLGLEGLGKLTGLGSGMGSATGSGTGTARTDVIIAKSVKT